LRRPGAGLAALAALAVLATGACAPPRLGQFEATLARHDSATAALEDWCAARRIAPEARVAATTLADASAPGGAPGAAAAARRRLGAGPGEPLGYRHVRLDCGGTALSEAYNWFVPARLTSDMNRALATTRLPFGKVTAPLGYRRERIESRRGAAEGCPAGTVLSHRALLRLPDGRALALVVECYTAANLGR